jgi:site-specific DNA-methyltransferase (adenine-specific)
VVLPVAGIGYHGGARGKPIGARPTDSGTAARFFYCAKAGKAYRAGSKHPTIKPVALMRWLVRLVTPPGGVVLDPFAGSGTTGAAALAEGRDAILIEREPEYMADIRRLTIRGKHGRPRRPLAPTAPGHSGNTACQWRGASV